MLADVDKLRHGPAFEISEIDIFDGRGQRTQYMVLRNIIEVLREIFENPEFKDEMVYAPVKLWTSAYGGEQVMGELRASRWWWNEQVSFILIPGACGKLTFPIGKAGEGGEARRDDCAAHSRDRPDRPFHHVRRPKGISGLHIDREYQQEHAAKAE